MINLANKHTLVVGLGVTGIAVAHFLKKNGSLVTVTDISKEPGLYPAVAGIRNMDIRMELGQHKTETFKSADLIILSPGVPHTIAPIISAKDKGIPVLGEFELASRFIQEPIVAVTGTNGKTTTTTLLGEILKKSGFKVYVGGNIGNPLIGYLNQAEKADVIVAEVSSFQLDTIETFRPKIGVLLNLSADHLDRYPDFNAYAQAKCSIFKNQRANDTAIIKGSDRHIRLFSKNIKSRTLIFDHQNHSRTKLEDGALIGDNEIVFQMDESRRKILQTSTVNLPGKHNLENVAAASLAAMAIGADFEGIIAAIKDFRGLAHRLEYIATKKNVRYFNDSKATNLNSVSCALEAFSEPIVLIMGGRDKGSDFGMLNGLIQKRVKQLITLGEAGEKINSTFSRLLPVKSVFSMEEAVFQASKSAAPGEVVLLSPGCASFDMYRNYAERGGDFSAAVNRL